MALCGKMINCSRARLFMQHTYILNYACSRTFAAKKTNVAKSPKRPSTPFVAYYTSIKEELSEKCPNMAAPDRAKTAVDMYKSLGEEEKQKLSEAFAAEMKSYKKEKEAWWNKLTKAEQLSVLEEKENEALKKKERKALKEVSKPKKPPSGYALFLKQKWESLSYGERSEANVIETGKLFAKEWASLSTEEKERYGANDVEMAEYKKQQLEWEKMMMEKGVPSLVRAKTLRQLTEKETPKKEKKTTKKETKSPKKEKKSSKS